MILWRCGPTDLIFFFFFSLLFILFFPKTNKQTNTGEDGVAPTLPLFLETRPPKELPSRNYVKLKAKRLALSCLLSFLNFLSLTFFLSWLPPSLFFVSLPPPFALYQVFLLSQIILKSLVPPLFQVLPLRGSLHFILLNSTALLNRLPLLFLLPPFAPLFQHHLLPH